jgi:hypothetical protein
MLITLALPPFSLTIRYWGCGELIAEKINFEPASQAVLCFRRAIRLADYILNGWLYPVVY